MTVMLCGCGDVSYTFVTKYDGSIEEEYAFSINTDELGTGAGEIMASIAEKLTLLKQNYLNDFFVKVENSDLSAEQKNLYLESYSCYANQHQESEKVFTYYFGFNYSSRVVYEFAWDINSNDEDEKNNLEYEYNFLTYNIIQKTKTKFGAPVKIDNDTTVPLGKYLWDYAYDLVKTKSGTVVANNLTKPTFVYNYVTTSSRLHSSADRIYNDRGYYVHSFNVEYDTVEKDIYFYQTEARREIWYSIILGVSIITVSLIFLVDNIREKNKIKNKENAK